MGIAVRPSLKPLGIRAMLALVLAGGFAFRVLAFPAAWGCVTATSAAHHEHTPDHQQGQRHHAPAMPACICIAHVSPGSLTPRPLELAAPKIRALQGQVLPPREQLPLVTASGHLRPFSIGPPRIATG